MNGEIFKMNLFIIFFILVVLLYMLTLTFIGKRNKKAHTEAHTEEVPTHVYSEHFPWEEKQIAYNRMHGLPDDAI